MTEKIVLTCDAKLWKRPMDMQDFLLFGVYDEDGVFYADRIFPIDETMVDFLSRFDKIELNFEKSKK